MIKTSWSGFCSLTKHSFFWQRKYYCTNPGLPLFGRNFPLSQWHRPEWIGKDGQISIKSKHIWDEWRKRKLITLRVSYSMLHHSIFAAGQLNRAFKLRGRKEQEVQSACERKILPQWLAYVGLKECFYTAKNRVHVLKFKHGPLSGSFVMLNLIF